MGRQSLALFSMFGEIVCLSWKNYFDFFIFSTLLAFDSSFFRLLSICPSLPKIICKSCSTKGMQSSKFRKYFVIIVVCSPPPPLPSSLRPSRLPSPLSVSGPYFFVYFIYFVPHPSSLPTTSVFFLHSFNSPATPSFFPRSSYLPPPSTPPVPPAPPYPTYSSVPLQFPLALPPSFPFHLLHPTCPDHLPLPTSPSPSCAPAPHGKKSH